MLTRLFSKSFKLGFSSSGTKNFQMYKLGFEETENQRSDCQYSLHHGESKGVSEKYLLLLHELHENLWLYGSQQTVENSFKETGVPDHLTCLLKNLYVGQEATVRILHGTNEWLKMGKGVRQGCIWSLCLFNFNAEYIMWNTGLDESKAVFKDA